MGRLGKGNQGEDGGHDNGLVSDIFNTVDDKNENRTSEPIMLPSGATDQTEAVD